MKPVLRLDKISQFSQSAEFGQVSFPSGQFRMMRSVCPRGVRRQSSPKNITIQRLAATSLQKGAKVVNHLYGLGIIVYVRTPEKTNRPGCSSCLSQIKRGHPKHHMSVESEVVRRMVVLDD